MNTRDKRVVLLADTHTHMMPALAREMARRNHNLVLGDAQDGLADELVALGAEVKVVPDASDHTREDTIQRLVDRANDTFGGFDSACIRIGVHGTGNILEATAEDCRIQYEGNFRSVFYALKTLLPPLVKQQSGQIVINTSAVGLRPQAFAALYCATHAGANALIRTAGLTAARYGVAVNGTGTFAMNYPGFLSCVGVDAEPREHRHVEEAMPMRTLCEPEEAAYFAASLIDGRGTFQTGQFFAIDGGWSFM